MLLGLALFLAGAAWDITLHLLNPNLEGYEHTATFAVPAHGLLVAGGALSVAAAVLTLIEGAWAPTASTARRAMLFVQAAGLIGFAIVGLNFVIARDDERYAHGSTAGEATDWHSEQDEQAQTAALPNVRFFEALLSQPIDEADLPNGFSAPRYVPHPASERLLAHNAIGGVNLIVTGPDLGDQIGFRVFPGEEEAAGYFEPTSIGPDFLLTSRSEWPEAGYPARCETYTYVGQGRPISGTDCLARVGSVVVVGSAALDGSVEAVDTTNATALARAGIDHIEQIRLQGH